MEIPIGEFWYKSERCKEARSGNKASLILPLSAKTGAYKGRLFV
jgi:hypothetical protein